MRREDVKTLIGKIPVRDHPKVVIVLKAGNASVSIDTVMRQEPEYLVVRGREAGTNDEGRAFFVPYEEISYIKIERLVRLNEIRAMYGEALVQTNSLSEENDTTDEEVVDQTPVPGVKVPVSVPVATDPASIAKQNLLDRIRAARTSAGRSGK